MNTTFDISTTFTTFCDNCGCSILPGLAVYKYAVSTPLSSVNVGESATVCIECDSDLKDNYSK
jgi:hypothetical protein